MAIRCVKIRGMAQSIGDTLIESLQDPCRYDFPVSRVDLVETHISWVLLTGRFAYKIKKPVNFGFVDFSTLEKRREACRDELRLNQRLAPQLYIDVVPITGTSKDPILGGSQTPIEYAVKIVQFPASARLDRVLQSGELLPKHIDALAGELAEFHARADVADASSPYLWLPRFYQPIDRNLESLRKLLDAPHAAVSADPTIASEIQQRLARLALWTRREFDRRAAIFASRGAMGLHTPVPRRLAPGQHAAPRQ